MATPTLAKHSLLTPKAQAARECCAVALLEGSSLVSGRAVLRVTPSIPRWVVVPNEKMRCLRCGYYRPAVLDVQTRKPRRDTVVAFGKQHSDCCGFKKVWDS